MNGHHEKLLLQHVLNETEKIKIKLERNSKSKQVAIFCGSTGKEIDNRKLWQFQTKISIFRGLLNTHFRCRN